MAGRRPSLTLGRAVPASTTQDSAEVLGEELQRPLLGQFVVGLAVAAALVAAEAVLLLPGPPRRPVRGLCQMVQMTSALNEAFVYSQGIWTLGAFGSLSDACSKFCASKRRPWLCSKSETCRAPNIAE